MSDGARKPGSLRDRIAMFEQTKSSAQAAAPAPAAPRGKVSWKPKPIEHVEEEEEKKASSGSGSGNVSGSAGGAMSASDARESIGRVGGLKERMAALQGKGGFGAPPPVPSAPKPVVRRPLASPDLTTSDDAAPEQHTEHDAEHESAAPVAVAEDDGQQQEEQPEAEKTEEELERERRAALAAKMARLGGTRVGMAPVFGRPAPPPKPKRLSSDKPTSPPPSTEAHDQAVESAPKSAEPVQLTEPPTHIDLPERTLSPASVPLPETPATHAVQSPPTSMPLPAVPRRAMPPRKKATPKKEEVPAVVADSTTEPASTETGSLVADAHEAAKALATKEADKDVSTASATSVAEESLAHDSQETTESSEHDVVEPQVPAEAEQKHADAPVTTDAPAREEPVHTPADEIEESEPAIHDVETHEPAVEASPVVKDDEEHLEDSEVSESATKKVTELAPDLTDKEHAHEPLRTEVPAIPEEREYMADVVDPAVFDSAEKQEQEHASHTVHARALSLPPSTQSTLDADAGEDTEESTPDEPAVEVPAPASEEDEEAARRARIAEKLSKMGGFNPFGAPAHASAPPPRRATSEEEPVQEAEQDDEDEEDARRARIAEKLAKMGGRNAFGAPPPPPARRPSHPEDVHEDPKPRVHAHEEPVEEDGDAASEALPEEGQDEHWEPPAGTDSVQGAHAPAAHAHELEAGPRPGEVHEAGATATGPGDVGLDKEAEDVVLPPRSDLVHDEPEDALAHEVEPEHDDMVIGRISQPPLRSTYIPTSPRTSIYAAPASPTTRPVPPPKRTASGESVASRASRRISSFDVSNQDGAKENLGSPPLSPKPKRTFSGDSMASILERRRASFEDNASPNSTPPPPPPPAARAPPPPPPVTSDEEGDEVKDTVASPLSRAVPPPPITETQEEDDVPPPTDAVPPQSVPEQTDAEEVDDEEATRRARLAKIAKMGGVNPFGAPHIPPPVARRPIPSAPAVARPPSPPADLEEEDLEPEPEVDDTDVVDVEQENEEEDTAPPLPPPPRSARSDGPLATENPAQYEEPQEQYEQEPDNDSLPPPPPPPRPTRTAPTPPVTTDAEEDVVPPPLPSSRPPVPASPALADVAPPPPPPRAGRPQVPVPPTPSDDTPPPPPARVRPPVPIAPRPIAPAAVPAVEKLTSSTPVTEDEEIIETIDVELDVEEDEERDSPIVPRVVIPHHADEEEFMDEDDTDPIDPSFHTPTRSTPGTPHEPQSAQIPSPMSPTLIPSPLGSRPVIAPKANAGEDQEEEPQPHKQTLAERMAKLGAIKIGGPPPMIPRRAPRQEESEDGPSAATPPPEAEDDAVQSPTAELTEEERRRAISARLAAQGGMRIGMLPMAAAPPPPPAREHPRARSEDSVRSASSGNVPARTIPPPPQPVQEEQDSDYGPEVDERELQEAQEVAEPEPLPVSPPPPPPARRPSVPSAPSSPPLPPGRRSSVIPHPPPPSRAPPSVQDSHADYVFVEEEAPPPPPPPRSARPASRPPPATRSPPPAASTPRSSTPQSGQWEIPSIGAAHLDLSLGGAWGADVPTQLQPQAQAPSRRSLDGNALHELGVRVGTRVLQSAHALASHARNHVVGDGTSAGFVRAVLDGAGVTAPAENPGHIVYSQTAGAVSVRKSEIVAGDVVRLRGARFHGRKGLSRYTLDEDDTLAVVIEVEARGEAKGYKLRALKANQSPSAASVEQVSYRLNDLQNGTVQVYRVDTH